MHRAVTVLIFREESYYNMSQNIFNDLIIKFGNISFEIKLHSHKV